MQCPNCDYPTMEEVRMTGEVTAYTCVDCGYVERREEAPIQRHCTNCNSAPGSPCTRATDNSRVPVAYFHNARVYQ